MAKVITGIFSSLLQNTWPQGSGEGSRDEDAFKRSQFTAQKLKGRHQALLRSTKHLICPCEAVSKTSLLLL